MDRARAQDVDPYVRGGVNNEQGGMTRNRVYRR